jgi:DNA-binding NarL/FixJ family response regulator
MRAPTLATSANAGRDVGTTPVVVMASLRLLRDAVAAALRGLGFAASSRPLPTSSSRFDETRRWLAQERPTLGVLITDLDDPTEVHDAVAVVRGLDLPWLLLTSAAPGPAWGALLDAGAVEVLDAASELAEVGRVIHRLVAGGGPSAPNHATVLDAWRRVSSERRALTERVERLSARELEILVALGDGLSPTMIAERDGVAVSTVRAQVRSVLHKLEVRTQLRAVAAYREEQEWIRRWSARP